MKSITTLKEMLIESQKDTKRIKLYLTSPELPYIYGYCTKVEQDYIAFIEQKYGQVRKSTFPIFISIANIVALVSISDIDKDED